MSSDKPGTAIQVRGLGKRYLLGEGVGTYATLRETLAASISRRGKAERRELWALRDVSLDVGLGESVGIIGRNGAGKTTLLKILAQITPPTSGLARTKGRVGALLAAGTGFHPELTGRENIVFGGAIMGAARREVVRHFDDIVDFAGVAGFLDTPLKRYSSGMQLRLGFAVAAYLEPEIVMVDEVLAVGDLDFQHRVLTKMNDIGRDGRTVLFVSHDLGAIARVCPRVVLLDGGRVVADGDTATVVNEYRGILNSAGGAKVVFDGRAGDPLARVRLQLANSDGSPTDEVRRDEPLVVCVTLDLGAPLPSLDISLRVVNAQGVRIIADAWSDHSPGWAGPHPAGRINARVEIPPVLPAGEYTLGIWVGDEVDTYLSEVAFAFRVLPTLQDRSEMITRTRAAQPTATWAVNYSAERGA